MKFDPNLQTLFYEFRVECRDDEVAFSDVLSAARIFESQMEVREAVALIAEGLLDDDAIKVGQWHASKPIFLVWRGTNHELVARLLGAWDDMTTEPQPGDVACFSAVEVRDIPYAMENGPP